MPHGQAALAACWERDCFLTDLLIYIKNRSSQPSKTSQVVQRLRGPLCGGAQKQNLDDLIRPLHHLILRIHLCFYTRVFIGL